jgi:hypothetical protein
MRDPTIERRSLVLLLAMHPLYDLLSVDWQLADDDHGMSGVWILVNLGQPSDGDVEAWAVHHFAIFKETGAVHGLDHDGAVTDDPLFTVG